VLLQPLGDLLRAGLVPFRWGEVSRSGAWITCRCHATSRVRQRHGTHHLPQHKEARPHPSQTRKGLPPSLTRVTRASTMRRTSGLPSRVLVWPSNSGEGTCVGDGRWVGVPWAG
jgi:hypothetical protein